MKFFTLPALFVAALFSALVVVPFLPVAKSLSAIFALEVRMTSTSPGQVVLYYDSGRGFSESAVSREGLAVSDTPVTYRLPLPPGSYRAFRFDPVDRDGTVRISSLAIVGPGGRVVRSIGLRELRAIQQVQSLAERDGRLDLVVTPGANDPQLLVEFAPPLVVAAGVSDFLYGWVPRSAVIFAACALLLFALDRAPGVRAAIAARTAALAARPGRAVAVVAAVAVLASAYPVVFLGKSYVSPNLGTNLLYDVYPTLPGYDDGNTTDVKGSDVGAIMWQHVPYSMMQHRALAHGELPLWNRYNTGGTPLLAQGQSMFGDPLHFLVVLADGAAWAWDFKYVFAKWLFAAGLGLIVLQLTRPGPLLPALLVAVAAPFAGFFVYRVNHPAFFSLCYAPWVLYCWLRVSDSSLRQTTVRWSAGLVVANLALMTSGTVKEAYMLLLCLNFTGAAVLLSAAQPLRVRLAKLAGLAWAGVIFVLLTAPIWATFLHTLGNAYTSYNAVSAFQLQPGVLLGAFDELFLRPLMAEERTLDPSVNFLILAGLLYFLATLRQHFSHRAAVTLAIASLIPLALAFGLVPPAWVVRIPFLSNVAHLDNSFGCVLIVLWSVLAGLGFAAALRRLGTPEGRDDLIVGGLLLFGLVFAWVAYRQAAHRPLFGAGTTFSALAPGQVIPVAPFIWGSLGVLVLAIVVFALAARRACRQGRLTPALGLLLAVCAGVFLWRLGAHASAVGFENYVSRPTARADFHARSAAMEDLRAAHAREPFRAFGFNNNFHPGWTGAYGLETIHGPDALVNPFMREFVTAVVGQTSVERWWDWRVYVAVANAASARPVFDALNVRYYLNLPGERDVLSRALPLSKTLDLEIYESPTAWPRAFFTDRVEPYDRAEEFVSRLRSSDGRPFAAVQRSDIARTPALLGMPRGLDGRTITAASDYVLTGNTTTFTVKAKSAGLVVLSEVFWPGDFRASVNGNKAPVLRLNHTFKGVLVDGPGEYRITFSYVPRNWPRNLALCGVGAALLALSLWFGLRSGRSAPVPAKG